MVNSFEHMVLTAVLVQTLEFTWSEISCCVSKVGTVW